LAPRELGARLLGQTPTTDPKSLVGRVMDIGVPEITGDNSKYYMKVSVRISRIEGKTCLTSFSGFECLREHLMRMVRKRNQKVENVFDVVTKDGWLLRIKPWTILNGKPAKTAANIMRLFTANFFNDFARKNSMSELVRKVISTEIQMRIKREGSKIYPVRFSEIARIKVLRSPEFRATKPKPEEKPAEEKPKKETKPKKK
jgi:small subunit ribosomal protein S3Ae